jgi:hypothetical protein
VAAAAAGPANAKHANATKAARPINFFITTPLEEKPAHGALGRPLGSPRTGYVEQ